MKPFAPKYIMLIRRNIWGVFIGIAAFGSGIEIGEACDWHHGPGIIWVGILLIVANIVLAIMRLDAEGE